MNIYPLNPTPPAAIVSSGDLTALTAGQQSLITEGTLVTITSGERYQYTGTGDKTLAASYILISDTTPDWSILTGKPSTFAPSTHALTSHTAAANRVFYSNNSGTLTELPLGASGEVLTSNGTSSAPSFALAVATVPDGDKGDITVTGTGSTWTIDPNAVTNAKLAQAASGTLKGRTAPGTGDVSDLTASDVRALLNVADGAEANVQANWTESNAALDSFIQNKPTLGGAALLNVGTTTGTVAAGDDSRLSDARTPTAHTHGNITNDGKIGITSGLPVVTTTSGTLTTLPLGTAGQSLVVNSGATALEFATPAGGVTSVTGTSPIASSGGATPAISIADAVADGATKGAAAFNANDFDSASGVISLDYTNGQSASASDKGFLTSTDWTTFNNKTGGSVGAVDNAILRADGTGGSTLQNSGLIVDDAVVAYSVTGDAATDVITATGHNFTTNQAVLFSSITGGSGLNTSTNYFVRDISGDTFKVSTTSGGAAVNFTPNITAGSVIAIQANVAISQNTPETNSSLVLTPKGTGALLAQKPDGTTTGGNARGARAVDFQLERNANTQVASGANSFIGGGRRNTASGLYSVICGGTGNTASGVSAADAGSVVVCGAGNTASGDYGSFVGVGASNTASGSRSFVGGGGSNTASSSFHATVVNGFGNLASGENAFIGSGVSNTASATNAGIITGRDTLANRFGMQAHSTGQFAAQGDAQRARFVLRNKTTTNAAVELFLDGSTTRLTIPSGKIFAFTINISGVKSDGSAVAHYLRQYALKNVAGTTSEVYAPVTIGTDNAAGTSIALSANDTNDALKVEVTGIASETWRWVASVDAVEIAYGA